MTVEEILNIDNYLLNNTESVIYVAILFKENAYKSGMDDVFDLFQSQFPDSKLVFEKYYVDGTIAKTNSSLDDFIQKHPTGNRVTICELTSITNASATYMKNNNLDILTLSVYSTAITTQKLPNTITYAYFVSYQVITSFYILQDYGIKNITILFDSKSTNILFFTSWKDTFYKQYLLISRIHPGFTYQEIDISQTDSYNIPSQSIVHLLIDTIDLQGKFNSQIRNKVSETKENLICLTQLNYDIEDVFGNIPAIVPIPVPLVYTETSDIVFKALKNKSFYYSAIYSYYDILYKLNYCSNNGIFVNKSNFITANPFTNIPPSWSGGYQVTSNINGFNCGSYDYVFTKNVILNQTLLDNPPINAKDQTELYKEFNESGVVSRLKDSLSVFKTCSLFPNIPTKMIYLDQNYINIYDISDTNNLLCVKFDSNKTLLNNSFINSAETVNCKFFVNFDEFTNLITYIQYIFEDISQTYPKINQTMDKKIVLKYKFPRN